MSPLASGAGAGRSGGVGGRADGPRAPSVCGLLVLCVAALGACGGRGAAVAIDASEQDEAARLLAVRGDDPSGGPLREVDAAVADDLPVRAASLLRSAVLPAARHATDAIDEVEVETPRGRALKRDLLAALRARVVAFELYEQALGRGQEEDLELLTALRAQRQAAELLLTVEMDLIEVARGQAPSREGDEND